MGGAKMKSVISTHAKSAFLRLAKGLVRAAAVASMIVTFSFGSIGSYGLGWLGVSGLAITVATPAQANCLLGGAIRTDIPDSDCLEAQRTGCVRHLLTPDQYISCLKAQETADLCIIGGKVRNDLSSLDCAEAKATGCVRRLLTDEQYSACVDAQKR
jgi:hypothetical protein